MIHCNPHLNEKNVFSFNPPEVPKAVMLSGLLSDHKYNTLVTIPQEEPQYLPGPSDP